MKVPCKRCNGLILEKTALKNNGYSAYCWKKHLEENILSNKKIVEEIQSSKSEKVTYGFDFDSVLNELSDLEYYLKDLEVKPLAIYSKEQFCKIWLIKDTDQQNHYYNSYLNPLEDIIDSLDTNWLPLRILTHYEVSA